MSKTAPGLESIIPCADSPVFQIQDIEYIMEHANLEFVVILATCCQWRGGVDLNQPTETKHCGFPVWKYLLMCWTHLLLLKGFTTYRKKF